MEDHGRETGFGRPLPGVKPEPDGFLSGDIHSLAAPRPADVINITGIGIGGAPTRCTTLPDDPQERKKYPIATGVLDYFPDAIAAVARVSWQGNQQHNPGQPLHWARGKSGDEWDALIRHFLNRGSYDKDGIRHSAKLAWRALAALQKEIEAEQKLQAMKEVVEKPFVNGPGDYLGLAQAVSECDCISCTSIRERAEQSEQYDESTYESRRAVSNRSR